MRKLAIAAAFALAATSLSAGGLTPNAGDSSSGKGERGVEPLLEPDVMQPSTDSNILLPLVLILVAGLVAFN